MTNRNLHDNVFTFYSINKIDNVGGEDEFNAQQNLSMYNQSVTEHKKTPNGQKFVMWAPGLL